ncbi:MAG: HAMP domain-containing protein [Thermodesulfobacteria bacterium]|nr:HAMP domain-containing protein [Thermodesulfobacteriota bacterium]
MNSSSHTSKKTNRERILAAVIAILLIVFAVIEYKLVSFIKPLPKYSNVLIFAVININLLLILVLSFLVIRNVVKLLFEERSHILGAKLKTKLTVAFVIISLLPTILLFFISFQFLNTSLAYWFDIKIERSLEQAISIGRNYYKDQINQIRNIEDVLARQIFLKCTTSSAPSPDPKCIKDIFSPAAISNPAISCIRKLPINYVCILDRQGNPVWKKTWLPITSDVPIMDRERLFSAGKDDFPIVESLDLPSGTLLKVAQPLMGPDSSRVGFIIVGRVIGQDIISQLEAVKQGFEEYKQLKIFQSPLKTSLLSTLFLITLLIIFVSIWFAFKLARSITEPVLMLADATHRVAQGDLNFKLETKGRDELSGLVRAFNTMTKDLKEARRKAEEASRRLLKSYSELEHRKAYIEMLLENVTAGVISLDPKGRITTINRSACQILQRDASSLLGKDYRELIQGDDFSELEGVPQELRASGIGSIKKSCKINVGGSSKSLIINFSLLKDKDRISGVLIVFDDLTELEKIQRLAAWRDVARRIAHEIKNPLTPIQLSAQRLKRKFINKFEEKELEVFKRCTDTIINQTDELKKLVNEFSRFARMPAPVLKPTDIRPILQEIEEIYRPLINVSTEISTDFPKIIMDPEQIKRVFINIIDNSISAGQARNVSIKCFVENDGKTAVISIADDGKGISREDISKVFDPYFSRKKGGTGLGLAIVKSIIDAHDATIEIELNKPSGVIFYIKFKVETKKRPSKPSSNDKKDNSDS